MQSPLDGAWELVSGQPLPEGTRDVKILADGHFMFTAYDIGTGKPLYMAGGTYTLDGTDYVEHMSFGSEKMEAAGLIGKDHSFTVKIEGETLKQTGTLANGRPLEETFRRVRA